MQYMTKIRLLWSPAGRLATVAIFVACLIGFYQRDISQVQRVDHRSLEFVEDSSAGNSTRYRILARGSDNGGAYATVELLMRAGGSGFYPGLAGSIPLHSHRWQQEQLVVKQGVLGYALNGSEPQEAGEGEELTFPSGLSHTVWVGGGDAASDVLLEVTMRPAGGSVELWENLAGLGATYGTPSQVPPLQLLLLFETAGLQLEGLPLPIQWGVRTMIVPLAQLLGFKASYPEYATAQAAAAVAVDS